MSGLTLKSIALLFMLIDHLGYFFPDTFPIFFRLLGRISAPIFYFLLVEGFFNTSSRKKYLIRLSIAAFVTSIGNSIITILLPANSSIVFNSLLPNIFFSLTLSFIIMLFIEKFKQSITLSRKGLILFSLFTIITINLATEYSIYSIFMTLTFYFCRNHLETLKIVFILGVIGISTSTNNSIQIPMILSLFLIAKYNSKKGISSLKILNNKYFFYVFYTLHLWSFYALSTLI